MNTMGFSQGQQVGAGGLSLKQKLLLESDDSASWSRVEALPPSVFVFVYRWGMPHARSFKERLEGSYTSWSVVLQAREDGRCTLRSGNSWPCVCLQVYICVPVWPVWCFPNTDKHFLFLFPFNPWPLFWLAIVRRKKCHIQERKGSCFPAFWVLKAQTWRRLQATMVRSKKHPLWEQDMQRYQDVPQRNEHCACSLNLALAGKSGPKVSLRSPWGRDKFQNGRTVAESKLTGPQIHRISQEISVHLGVQNYSGYPKMA